MRVAYIVIYTDALEECRVFYAGLGIRFRKERHEDGPVHHAAVLEDGAVIELYPAAGKPSTGRLRLGFTVRRSTTSLPLGPGRHVLRDPEGRTVELEVIE